MSTNHFDRLRGDILAYVKSRGGRVNRNTIPALNGYGPEIIGLEVRRMLRDGVLLEGSRTAVCLPDEDHEPEDEAGEPIRPLPPRPPAASPPPSRPARHDRQHQRPSTHDSSGPQGPQKPSKPNLPGGLPMRRPANEREPYAQAGAVYRQALDRLRAARDERGRRAPKCAYEMMAVLGARLTSFSRTWDVIARDQFEMNNRDFSQARKWLRQYRIVDVETYGKRRAARSRWTILSDSQAEVMAGIASL